jgi:glycolate oxidase
LCQGAQAQALQGAVLAIKGGLILDLHLMNNIIEINKKDFYARVETGVILIT